MFVPKFLVGVTLGFTLLLACGYARVTGVTVSSQTMVNNLSWKAETREAVEGATNELQKNLLVALTELERDTFQTSRTIKFQIGTLITALVNSTFDFAGIIASAPKFLTESLPTQLVSILRGMQNDSKITPELNTTISTLIEFILDAEQSGASQNLFRPATNVIPNLLSGVNRFLVSILNGFFFVIGARDPNVYYRTSTTQPSGL